MHAFALEFDTERDVRDEYKRLTQKMGLTGEFGIKPAGDKWRLEVVSERQVGEGTLAKLRGRLVQS